MLARPATRRRAARLYELCLLERELGILSAQRSWLEQGATTCRRLVTAHTSFAQHDEAMLVLAGLELRLDRPAQAGDVLADLLEQHPKSSRRCAALLLAADAKRAQARSAKQADTPAAAAAVARGYAVALRARACLGAAHRDERLQARYRRAWGLVRAGKVVGGEAEFRRVLTLERPSPRFAARVLRDLAALWSTQQPPADAVRFLKRWAGESLGATLSARVAEGLVGQRRLKELLRFTDAAAKHFRAASAQQALWQQRLAGLATLGSAEQLLAQARAVTSRPEARGKAVGRWSLRRALAAALWQGAERWSAQSGAADEPSPSGAAAVGAVGATSRRPDASVLALYRLLAERFVGAPEACRARLRLADFATQDGRWAVAAKLLRAALREAPEALRAEARYRLIVVLQRQAGQASAARRAAAREAFLVEAKSFLQAARPDQRAATLRLAVLDALVEGKQWSAVEPRVATFLRVHPRHAASTRVRQQAIVAARALGAHQAVYRWALPLGKEPRWAAVAAEAALAQARLLVKKGGAQKGGAQKGGDAQLWIDRARPLARGPLAQHVRLLGALLAARGADGKRLDTLRVALMKQARGRDQRRLQHVLAGWYAALGQLDQAAALELAAAREEPRAEERVARQLGAAELLLDAGAKARAETVLRLLQRDLQSAGAPSRRLAEAMVRLGKLLERSAPRRAYGYYLQGGDALWRSRRRLAARLLLRAVALAPSARRATQLWRQAVELAGRPRRGGQIDELAVQARLALVQSWRQRGWDRGEAGRSTLRGAERRLQALASLYEPLLPILALRHAHWSAAAGLQIAWVLERMAAALELRDAPATLRAALARRRRALAKRRRIVLASLGRLLQQPGGLNRYTLQAARSAAALSSPLWLQADLLPTPSSITKPALRALRSGRAELAVRLADHALALHGTQPELLCVRAVAQVRAGRPEAAADDLQAARLAKPTEACARLNLATMALWRGASAEARALVGDLAARRSAISSVAGGSLRRLEAALASRPSLASARGSSL